MMSVARFTQPGVLTAPGLARCGEGAGGRRAPAYRTTAAGNGDGRRTVAAERPCLPRTNRIRPSRQVAGCGNP